MPPSKCTCGLNLPDHLLGLSSKGLTHVCTCERRWREASGKWIEDGTEKNPFNARPPKALS